MDGRIRILVCDGVPEMRALLHEMLEEESDMTVVATCGDGDACVASAAEHDPGVVLLDLSMPGRDGLETLAPLRRAAPRAKIVVFSSLGAERMGEVAIALGADRYVEKGRPIETLVAAIRDVAGSA